MTGFQARESLKLLGWTTERLASFSGIPAALVRASEATGRVMEPPPGQPILDRAAAIRRALEAAGVKLIDANGGGLGVRLQKAVTQDNMPNAC